MQVGNLIQYIYLQQDKYAKTEDIFYQVTHLISFFLLFNFLFRVFLEQDLLLSLKVLHYKYLLNIAEIDCSFNLQAIKASCWIAVDLRNGAYHSIRWKVVRIPAGDHCISHFHFYTF